jgi:branched-chain amino acid transport system permease protein
LAQFFQLTLNGLTVAAIYSLIALGFSLIFNVSRVLNLAQGSFYTLVAFVAFTMLRSHFNLYLALAISIAAVTLVGLVFERWVITPAAAGSNINVLLMLTLALSMILEGAMKLIWGTDPVALPPLSKGYVTLFGNTILAQNLWIIAGAVLILLVLYLFFKYTFLGKAMTAVAENPLAAGIMGINAGFIRATAFAISALIGAIGGILASPVTLVAYDSAVMIGLKGFIAAVVGGVGNIFGGAIGAVVLALSESYSTGYISSLFQDSTSFLILIIVLIARSMRRKENDLHRSKEKYSAPLTVKLSRPGIALMGVLAVLVLLLPLVTSNAYVLGICTVIFIYILAALGLDLLHGFTGILSLGQAGFMAIAGYSSAILMRNAGLHPLVSMIIGVLLTLVVAWILAVATVRLTGYNIAIATLGFSVIIESVAVGWRDLTGGAAGFTGVPAFDIGFMSFSSERSIYYLTFLFMAAGFIIAYNLTRSQTGRVMKSIQQDPLAAMSLGVPVTRYKIRVFVISAAYAAISGILLVHYMNFISPGMVGMDSSIMLLVMLTLGGAGSLWGVIPGVVVLELIPEVLKSAVNYQIIIEGLILILVLMFFKGGIWSLLVKLGDRVLPKTRTNGKEGSAHGNGPAIASDGSGSVRPSGSSKLE